MTKLNKLGAGILQYSLWIVGFGLMLASSGLDGAFLTKLMPAGFGWLGLVLNTTTDVCSEVVSYWTGRLAQDANKRKREMSKLLWFPQFALVFYAWLFGWRQIIPILREIEPLDFRWLAPLMAAFVPTALVAVGYTQALLAGRIEKEDSEREAKSSKLEATRSEAVANRSEIEPLVLPFTCEICGATFASQNGLNGHKRKHRNGNGHKSEIRESEAINGLV